MSAVTIDRDTLNNLLDALAAEKRRADEAYAAGFRECQERAVQVADRQAKVSRDEQGWLDIAESAEEIAKAIRALAPAVTPPAPKVAPVKFDAAGRAGDWVRDGWDALHRGDELRVTIMLRPGEDAGELTARMLASVGRWP